MDCKRFRESLDLFVDGELSPEAMAAAEAHRRDCARCALATREVETLRQVIRQTVSVATLPSNLEQRVRESIRSSDRAVFARTLSTRGLSTRMRLGLAAALVLVMVGGAASAVRPGFVNDSLVALMDRAVVNLAVARPLELEATVLCRDCELLDRHGEPALCDRFGHRGALVTSDGRIWNIMEQDGSLDLVRDEAMLGRRVRVRGTLYRDAGTIAVDSYEVLVSMAMAVSHVR